MNPLPHSIQETELIDFADRWAKLMEVEDYDAAFALTDHVPEMGWTPALIREVIKAYGDAKPGQRVTLLGEPTDITQRKKVNRHPPTRCQFIGEIWYDLNLDGFVSDLTATFYLKTTPAGIIVYLNDIHVM